MSDEDQSEIYRVNKLLAIEDLDWKHQLEKAVSSLSRSRSNTSPNFLRTQSFLPLNYNQLLYFVLGFQG